MWRLPKPPIPALPGFARLGLAAKSALFFGVYSVAIIGVMLAIGHLEHRRQAERLVEQNLDGLTVAIEARIQAFLRASRHQMATLVDSYPFRRYARALERDAAGEQDFAAIQVADLLRAHLAGHDMHYQARVIDATTGMELIRLDKGRASGAISQATDLQDKSHRDYFQELKGRGGDRFYVSAVNLNRERGAVEMPRRPTLRLAAHLTGAEGRPVAFLVLNIAFNGLLDDLARLIGEERDLLVLDEFGRYLVHPDPSRAFAFEFGRVESLAVDAPKVAQALLTPRAGPAAPWPHVFTADLPLAGEPQMAVLRRMEMGGGDNLRTLIVGVTVPAAGVYPNLGSSLARGGEAMAVLLVVGLFATLLVARIRGHGQRVETTRAKLAAVLETAQDAIILTDGAGRIQEANPATARMFDLPAEALPGRPLGELVPSLGRLDGSRFEDGVWQPPAAEVLGPEEDRFIRLARRADGSAFPVQVSLAELPLGRARRLAALLHDQSEIVAARRAAEAANFAKSQFLTAMSHELRTPLNAVLLYSQMVAEDLSDSADPEMLRDLDRIHKAGAHLLDLVNGVLDLARIETGRMEVSMAPFEMGDLITDTVSLAGPLARQNHNRLVVEAADEVGQIVGDRLKLRQCLINLVSNAAKFTEDGTITLAAWRQDDALFLEVRDTGIGMTEEQMGRVFNVFEQADARIKAQFGGSGVGLALTRQFVELMGGTIEVASWPDQGSRFTIRLPAVAITPAPVLPEEVSGAGRRMVVLVVDDDPAMRALLSANLDPEHHEVIGLPTGQRALEYVAARSVDMILMDVLMPEMDGWDTLRALKGDPRTDNIPVLVVSIVGDREISDVQGACGHVRKPFRVDDIKAAVERCRICRLGRSVVVIEDDLNMRAALVRAVERAGLPAIAFYETAGALTHMKERPPGAVLLDLAMPRGPSGFDLLDSMAADPALARVPVFVVTGIELTSQQRRRLSGRCLAVLEKGAFDLEQLMAQLVEAVETRCPTGDPAEAAEPGTPPRLVSGGTS